MLTGPGVFCEQEDGRFAVTPLGATLQSDSPDSVREWALFVGAPEMWAVWSGLRDSVMTGQTAFPAVHGAPIWQYLTTHRDLGPSAASVRCAAWNSWRPAGVPQYAMA
jgi:hypothetical protein